MIHAIRRIVLLSCCLMGMLVGRAQTTTTDYTRYADPMIGTGGHEHTFPGGLCAVWDGAAESGYAAAGLGSIHLDETIIAPEKSPYTDEPSGTEMIYLLDLTINQPTHEKNRQGAGWPRNSHSTPHTDS